MSVGYITVKSNIDTRAGSLVVELRNKLVEIQNFKYWLDAVIDADLISYGYDTTDIDRLRGTFADLDKLARIFLGDEVQATPLDFRQFAKFLTGVS